MDMNLQQAMKVAAELEERGCLNEPAKAARTLLAHINSLASPQVTDEQIDRVTPDHQKPKWIADNMALMARDAASCEVAFGAEWAQMVAVGGLRLLNEYDAVLRGLCSFLAAGGYNSDGLIAPAVADEKIRWGIDHIIEVEKKRALSAPPAAEPFDGDPIEGTGQAKWREMAREYSNSSDFYRGIVVQIGEMFGEAARTSDDGSIQSDVLALKVPELVKAALTPAAPKEAKPVAADVESLIVKHGLSPKAPNARAFACDILAAAQQEQAPAKPLADDVVWRVVGEMYAAATPITKATVKQWAGDLETSHAATYEDIYGQCCETISPLVDAGKLPRSLVESVQILVDGFLQSQTQQVTK